MTQEPVSKSIQFVEVLEILEELNVQAARLKQATAKAMAFQRSEGGTSDADDGSD